MGDYGKRTESASKNASKKPFDFSKYFLSNVTSSTKPAPLVAGRSSAGTGKSPLEIAAEAAARLSYLTGATTKEPQVERSQQKTKKPTDDQDQAGKLFVGGLARHTTAETLREYFLAFGDISNAHVPLDLNDASKNRGFGFITFTDLLSVQTVVMNGPHYIDEKLVDPKPTVAPDQRQKQEPKFRQVFLGGLSLDTSAEFLKEAMEAEYGKVVSVHLPFDEERQKSRGFGFVRFEDDSVVDTLVAQGRIIINGKDVEVKLGRVKDPNAKNTPSSLQAPIQFVRAGAGGPGMRAPPLPVPAPFGYGGGYYGQGEEQWPPGFDPSFDVTSPPFEPIGQKRHAEMPLPLIPKRPKLESAIAPPPSAFPSNQNQMLAMLQNMQGGGSSAMSGFGAADPSAQMNNFASMMNQPGFQAMFQNMSQGNSLTASMSSMTTMWMQSMMQMMQMFMSTMTKNMAAASSVPAPVAAPAPPGISSLMGGMGSSGGGNDYASASSSGANSSASFQNMLELMQQYMGQRSS